MYILWLVLLGVLWCSNASAQLWSEILDPTRAVNWQGIAFTVPTTYTQCGSTINPPSSSAAINAAIAACGTNEYVQLAAGTFTATTGINFGSKSNVALRGAGANQTIINAGTTGCWAGVANICSAGNGNFLNGSPTIVNVTAGAAKDATSLTVSDASGISVNQYVIVTQLNEATSASYAPFIICEGIWMVGSCQGGQGTTRSVIQVVKVTAKVGNVLTISPGLYYQRWSQSRSPQVNYYSGGVSSFVTNVGVEDLTVAKTGADGINGAVQFAHAAMSWVKGIRVNGCATMCVVAYESAKISVLNSYFYNSEPGVSTHYGVACSNTTDLAVYNNVFQQIQTSLVGNGTCAGAVIAYNFTRNQPWNGTGANNSAIYPGHAAGTMYWLMEGNDSNGITHDLSHGTSCCQTAFRNFFFGRDDDEGLLTSIRTIPVIAQAWTSRFNSYLGNVMGIAGYHTNYESSQGPNGVTGSMDRTIFALGWAAAGESCGSAGCDTIVQTSSLRWGNYDVVTGTRFNASEIPSGNAVPGSQTLPSSFYLAAKPSWFGSITWPPIGSDVTGGSVSGYGGRVYRIPARVCYEDVMGGPANGNGNVLTFNAALCYGSGGTPPPDPTPLAAPTGLRVS